MAYVKSRDVPSGVGPVTIEAGGSEPSLARINR
jgi:hypothetical protein